MRLQGRCENPPREALIQNMDGGRSQKSSIYTMIAKQQKSEAWNLQDKQRIVKDTNAKNELRKLTSKESLRSIRHMALNPKE